MNDTIQFYEQMGSFKKFKDEQLHDLDDSDCAVICENFINLIDKIIDSHTKYCIYISIGGYSSNYQLFPKINHTDDYQTIYIGIDNFNYMSSELFNKYNSEDHIFLLNMYWIDTYMPLINSLRKLICYNIETNGIIICANYCKYRAFSSPIFRNLISLFYSKDLKKSDSLKDIYNQIFIIGIRMKTHIDAVSRNRCIYLDWRGYIEDDRNTKMCLVGYNNTFFGRKTNLLKNQLTSFEHMKNFTNTWEVYFNISQLNLR